MNWKTGVVGLSGLALASLGMWAWAQASAPTAPASAQAAAPGANDPGIALDMLPHEFARLRVQREMGGLETRWASGVAGVQRPSKLRVSVKKA